MAATPGGVAAIVNRMLRIPSEAGTCGDGGNRRSALIFRAFVEAVLDWYRYGTVFESECDTSSGLSLLHLP